VGSGIVGADFVVDSVMEISFSSSNYLLFNKETKEKIGAGSLKLHSKWTTFQERSGVRAFLSLLF
jgi:hypothetical protein